MNVEASPPPPPPPQPAGLPWERRAEVGAVQGFTETLRRLVVEPAAALGEARRRGDLFSPLAYAVLLVLIGVLAERIWGLLIGTSLLDVLPPHLRDNATVAFALSSIGLAVTLVVVPILVLVGIFIYGAIVHLFLMLYGGTRDSDTGYEGTVRALAWSTTSQLGQLVPFASGAVDDVPPDGAGASVLALSRGCACICWSTLSGSTVTSFSSPLDTRPGNAMISSTISTWMTTNGTVIEALEATARARPSRPALAAPVGGRWVETSWSDYRDLVFRAVAGLVRLGVPPATGVAIHSANRPEWAIADLAAIAAGAIPAGIFVTNSIEQCAYVADHTAARVAVADSPEALAKLLAVRERVSRLASLVLLDGESDGPGVVGWHSPLLRNLVSPLNDILISATYGLHCTIAYPEGFDLYPSVIALAQKECKPSGGKVEISHDLKRALEGADVVFPRDWWSPHYYTNTKDEELRLAAKHQDWKLSDSMLRLTNKARFIHCMPFDRGNEVDDSVADGPNSVVYDQAEDLLHVRKAILTYLLAEGGRSRRSRIAKRGKPQASQKSKHQEARVDNALVCSLGRSS